MTVPSTLSGVVDRVVYHKPENGFTVLRLKPESGNLGATLVGLMPPVYPGAVVRAEGAWRDDPTWGRQFQTAAVAVMPPATTDGLEHYLASGIIPGLGPALAKKLAKRFGAGLDDVIATAPERLRQVPGVGRRLADRIVEAWQGERAVREIMVFLQGHGIGPGRARAIFETYGADTVKRVTVDPYVLVRDVRGIGFRTADALALKMGVEEDAPIRLVAAVEQALREAADTGHTAVSWGELVWRAAELVRAEREALEGAIQRAARYRHVTIETTPEGSLVQLAHLAAAERGLAKHLGRLAGGRPPWRIGDLEAALQRAEEALGVSLAVGQRAAVADALTRKILIVTGGPGTGKTTLVRAILAALPDKDLDVALAAPTGRAAKRLTESTGREARTLHRLLEADMARGFRRGPERPLEVDLLIVDEASMIDTQLMHALLAALPDGAALLLVGDVDQLPSVGPGQVLADLIAAEAVPVVALNEIFRQAAASGIVANAHRINRGELPVLTREEGDYADFYGIRAHGPEDAAQKVLELMAQRIPERFGLDPTADVQVLCPMNRGALGTFELNRLLQARLNPNPPDRLERGAVTFAIGDRVMQIENDYDREVYNGDVGLVTSIDRGAGALQVTIDGRAVAYGPKDLDQLVLAYAVTVHKAQGSEYPAVVVVLSRQHGRMLKRRLLYTALTRARSLAVLVVEPEALARAVRDVGGQLRLTLLKERLSEVGPWR